MTPAEAKGALRAMHEAVGGDEPEIATFRVWQTRSPTRAVVCDPHGFLTLGGAREAYVRGDIEADELERRVELLLVAGGTAA